MGARLGRAYPATRVWRSLPGVIPPISILGALAANSSSVAIPAHAAGDLIVVFAFNASSTTVPTLPTAGGTVPTFTSSVPTTGGAHNAGVVACAYATGSSDTSGTWTSATSMIAVAIRATTTSSPIGGTAQNSGFGTSISGPTVTLTKTDGSSAVLYFYGAGDGSTAFTSWAAAPTGMTQQVAGTYATNKQGVCLDTLNVTTSAPAESQTNVGGPYFRAVTVEILAAQG